MSSKTNGSPSMTTLCLQSGSRRIPIELDASTTTVEDLYRRAAQEVDNDGVDSIQLRSGFPPRLLEPDGTKTLAECGIRHQDRIVVAITPPVAAPTTTSTASEMSPQRGRPKRKAAQAATAAFFEVIAQQDQAAAQATSRTKRASPVKKKKTTSAASHFAKLERKNGEAFRLRDGQQVVRRATSSNTRGGGKKKKGDNATTSLEEALVSSTGPGGLQGGWKAAVASAYAHNQAAARVASLTRDCVFEVEGDSNEGDDAEGLTNKQMKVTYPKGVQGRGTFSDSVTLLPLEALAAAIRSLTDVDGFRHMPLFSPRVYWSLRYHHQDTECRTVQECLQAVAPEMDWSALGHRHRALSEKARENLRQKNEAEMQEEEKDWEAAAEAIAAVENAMEMGGVAIEAPRETTIIATEASQWRVVTPDEEDLDELKECIQQRIDDATEMDAKIQLLLDHGIRNWRQLANRSSEIEADILTEWIDYAQAQTLEEIMVEICDNDCDAVEVLRDDANTGTPRDLRMWRRVVPTLQEQVPAYTLEQLQRWCDRAAAAIEQLPWLLEFQTPLV